MTISPELMSAILSMDAYNRGYAPGLSDGQHIEGNIDLGLGDSIGTLIGNASITARSTSDPNSAERSAGIYSIAYSWNGQTVVSFRGTDDFSTDVFSGWTLGAGDYN